MGLVRFLQVSHIFIDIPLTVNLRGKIYKSIINALTSRNLLPD